MENREDNNATEIEEDTDTILIKFLNKECHECGKIMSYGPIKITISYPSDDYEEEDEKKLVKKMCTKCHCTVYVDENEENSLEHPVQSTSRNQDVHMYPPNSGKFSGSEEMPKRCVICDQVNDGNPCIDCATEDLIGYGDYEEPYLKRCVICQKKHYEIPCLDCATKKLNSEYDTKRCDTCKLKNNENPCLDCAELRNYSEYEDIDTKRCDTCKEINNENPCLDCAAKETKRNSLPSNVEYEDKILKKCIHCDKPCGNEEENACAECITRKKGNSWSDKTGYEEYNIKRCFLCNHPLKVPNEDMCSDCVERENMKNSPIACSSKNCEISQYEAVRGASKAESIGKDEHDHLLGTSLDDFEYLEKKYAIEEKNHTPPEITMDVIKEEEDLSPPPVEKMDALIPTTNISSEEKEPSTLNLGFIEEANSTGPIVTGENNLQRQNASTNLVDSCEWKNEAENNEKNMDSTSVKSLEVVLSFDSNPELIDEQTQKPSLSDEEIQLQKSDENIQQISQSDPKNESILKELLISGYLVCSCKNCEPDKYKNLKTLYENACARKIDEIKNMKLDLECSKCKLKNYTDDQLNEHIRKIEDMLPICECSKNPDDKDEPTEITKPYFYV